MMKSILFRNSKIIINAASAATFSAGGFSRPLNPLIHSLNPNCLIPTPLPNSFASILPFSRLLSSSCIEPSSTSSSSPDLQKLFAETYQSRFSEYAKTQTMFCDKLDKRRDMIEKVYKHFFVEGNNNRKSSGMKSLKRSYSDVATFDLDFTCQHDSTRPYYELHDDWTKQLQTTVSILALQHWLETGKLISRQQVEIKLGIDPQDGYLIGIHVKDYLLGICLLCSKLPGYVEQHCVVNFDNDWKVWRFLKSVQALFKKLDLSNIQDDSFLEMINAARNGDYVGKVKSVHYFYTSPTSDRIKQFEETFNKELFKYSEIDKAIRLLMDSVQTIVDQMQEDLFVHGLCPVPDALEKATFHIEKLKLHFHDLAQQSVNYGLSEWTRPYYEHIDEWTNQRQTTVSILAFLHWLETGKLISHKEIAKKLGLYSLQKQISLDKINHFSGLGSLEGLLEFHQKDYLLGICLMSSKLPEYAEHLVNTSADYNCLRNVLDFSKDIEALLKTLRLDCLEDDDSCHRKLKAVMNGYDAHRVESICLKLDSIEDNNKQVLDGAVPDSVDENNNRKLRRQKLQLFLMALICLI